jgi:hypothetical protein
VILARGASTNGYAFLVRGGKPQFVVRANKAMASVSADQSVLGQWSHVAGVLTADKGLQIYVNGQLRGSAEAPGLIPAEPKEPMEIGADRKGAVGDYRSPFGFTGIIDEVRLYHRALSAEEIAKHAGGAGRPADEDTGLVLHFTFEGGDAADGSGNTNHGTVDGAQPAKGRFGQAWKFAGERQRPTRSGVKHQWAHEVPLHVRAMVQAAQNLFIAGPPDLVDEQEVHRRVTDPAVQSKLAEQAAALEGRKGAFLWAISPATGEKLAEYTLDAPPVWDGMAAANSRLFVSTVAGEVLCLGSEQ